MKSRLILVFVILVSLADAGRCSRIKDIVDIGGFRGNPLHGTGLVVGLAGTGDSTPPSRRLLMNILRDSGLVFSQSDLTSSNIAIVRVTAQLGPFDREGSLIDIDVSSIGDAKSLQGGLLLPTQLKGLDGQVYAVTTAASISLAGWTVSGDKASITKNHQAVGRIPDGAIVEKAEIANYIEYIGGYRFVTLNLRNSDFSTAKRIGEVINQSYPDSTLVVDPGTIKVKVPDELNGADIVGFVDGITKHEVQVDTPAVVVVNERTGTIVVGEKVGISSVAISQGSLVVKIKETATVSQPMAPFSDAGTTEVVPETMIGVQEPEGYLIPVPQMVTVSELANTLNAIGATPRDLIAIFNALKKAGALQAKLEIM